MKILYFIAALCLSTPLFVTATVSDNTLNVYNWSEYLPDDVLNDFQKETGIHVNYSTYDSNETLYAKLKANPQAGYDIVVPSTYFIDRMIREKMLTPLNKSKLTYFKNLNPILLNKSFDPGNHYSVPYLSSATGIVYNDQYYTQGSVTRWSDLWQERYRDKLLILDDVREVFSMALLRLGYSPNTTDPQQIHNAYETLVDLLPNIKLFNDEAVKAIYIDEDATIGMAWSGDIFLAQQDNPHIQFVYPLEGFIIALDSLAIPRYAPHIDNAYRFIDFVLRADIAARISQATGYMSPNAAAVARLPAEVRNNPVIYPNQQTLKRGFFQSDVGEASPLYEKYLERLKISA